MSPQFIEILIFAALTVFLLFRLRNVLGSRTGNEDSKNVMRPPQFGKRPRTDGSDVVIPMPRDAPETPAASPETPSDLAAMQPDDPLRKPLEQMKTIEPEFMLDEFLSGAGNAYEMIFLAYENGDKERLQPLLSPEVYGDFERGIDDRIEKNLTVDARFVRLEDSAVKRLSFDEATRRAEIEIEFVAEVITSVRNADGEVVEGDPGAIRRQKDHWVFERVFGISDPNWTLVET